MYTSLGVRFFIFIYRYESPETTLYKWRINTVDSEEDWDSGDTEDKSSVVESNTIL